MDSGRQIREKNDPAKASKLRQKCGHCTGGDDFEKIVEIRSKKLLIHGREKKKKSN